MTVQPSQTKNIKEHIARAKAHVGKQDVMRALHSLCEALGVLLKAQVFGREKFEIGILVDEVLRSLNQYPEVKAVAGADLSFPKGQEKALFLSLRRIYGEIKEARDKVQLETTRAQKMEIDELILQGQAHLSQKNFIEARKYFRRATERFPDERGILVDVGQRLIKAGQFAEALEYLERGMERDPTDPRPYSHLVTCYEALAEPDKAEDLLNNILRRFGANESVFLRLARLHLHKRKFNEAFEAADQALIKNPLSRDAMKILDAVGPKLFGGSYQRKTPVPVAPAAAAADEAAPVKPVKLDM